MMPRQIAAGLAAVLFTSLAGCASDGVETSTSFDPLTTFPPQATFVWDGSASRLPQDPRLRELDLDPMIKQAANGALAARGYRNVASGPADYQLSYEVGENVWKGPEGVTSLVSVSLVLVNAKSDRRAWVGFARAEAQPAVPREERARRLRAAFDEMLREFPPSGPSK
jgi:hypothetical protein